MADIRFKLTGDHSAINNLIDWMKEMGWANYPTPKVTNLHCHFNADLFNNHCLEGIFILVKDEWWSKSFTATTVVVDEDDGNIMTAF